MSNEQHRNIIRTFFFSWDISPFPELKKDAAPWVSQLCLYAYNSVYEPRTLHADYLLYRYAVTLERNADALDKTDFQTILKNAIILTSDPVDSIAYLTQWVGTPDTNRFSYCDQAYKRMDSEGLSLRDVFSAGYSLWAESLLMNAREFILTVKQA